MRVCTEYIPPEELIKVVDHFDKYPLLSKKRADFELFKSSVYMISRKEHLTTDGLKKIVAVKAVINKGLSADLKESFSDIIPVRRPEVQTNRCYKSLLGSRFCLRRGFFLC